MKPFLIEAILNTKLNTPASPAGGWPPEPIDNAKAFKGMTRRVVKNEVEKHNDYHYIFDPKTKNHYCVETGDANFLCPYGQPGDLLWVKESILKERQFENPNNPAFGKTIYCCDLQPGEFEKGTRLYAYNYKLSPLFMPKAAARIWLQIVDIKPERLQDISDEDSILEGIESCYPSQLCYDLVYKDYMDFPNDVFEWFSEPKSSFKSLICSINGPQTWKQNPWVWVISFKVISTTGRPYIPENGP